jgi:hypothetical protein
MKLTVTIVKELFGLFIDDGSLALALVLWCLFAGVALPAIVPQGSWSAPLFFMGCLLILLVNVAMASRRSLRPKH